MKKISITIFLLILFFGFSSYGLAHVLETSGSVGGVLHIDPADDPIVGADSVLYFDLQNSHGNLNLSNCVCRVVIVHDGSHVVAEARLGDDPHVEVSGSVLSYAFIFPLTGVYTVELKGNMDGDKEFTLSYVVRVNRGGDSEESPTLLNTFKERDTRIFLFVVVLIAAI